MAPLTIADLLERNKATVANHTPIPTLNDLRQSGDPAFPPKLMIITCLDARCIPEKFFNSDVGEIVVHRNAGGDARHALRDITIFDTIFGGIDEIAVVHHTDCGALRITEDGIVSRVKARVDPEHWHHVDALRPFGAITDVEESVKEQVEWLRAHPLVRDELGKGVHGFVFDLKTGKVEQKI
ncbi:Carbonic anhydrase [Naviculisporaceae sp. PSN 640]